MNYSLGNVFFRGNNDFFERGTGTREISYLKTDIYEKEDAYYLKIEVPGFNKNDLDISYENGYLTVTARKKEEIEEEGEYIRKERYTSEMQRSFYVGERKEDSIKANYENGILTISLEKEEEKTPIRKQIIIE